jgi:formyl-CoA transferase
MTAAESAASSAWTAATASGPLAGVRVLDFSEIIAAPFSTMLLADMGADVIKIEPPEGEAWRHQASFMPGESRSFMSLNRGKRGMAVDLKTAEGQAIAHALARDADVAVLNYRPDVPARLGIDYATLAALNPRLIYAWNTAFGRRGPHAHRSGYDIILQAMTGLMAGAGAATAEGLPATVGGTAVADFSTGLTLTWAICAALYARERSGVGQQIDTSLFASVLTVQTSRFFSAERADAEERAALLAQVRAMRAEGRPYPEIVNTVMAASSRTAQPGSNPYYRVYQTADDFLAVGCLSQRLRRRFAELVGLDDPRLTGSAFEQRSEESRAIGRRLVQQAEPILRGRSTAEWLARFDAAGIPAGPVRFAEELFDDEHVIANDLVVDLEHAVAGPLRMVGPPVQMSGTPLRPQGASPALGQHTDELLRALGYDEARITDLRARGIVR